MRFLKKFTLYIYRYRYATIVIESHYSPERTADAQRKEPETADIYYSAVKNFPVNCPLFKLETTSTVLQTALFDITARVIDIPTV